MKKTFLGLLAGLVLGGGAAWLWLRPSTASAPEAAAAAEPTSEKSGTGVHLSAEQLAQAGLTIAVPVSVSVAPEVKAYGRALDPAPLLALNAEVTAAQAASNASEKEYNRAKGLHEQADNVSAQAVETAEAALQRDRSALDSARARLNSGWGGAIASRPDFAEVQRALAGGAAALARVDFPGARPATAPTTARVGAFSDEGALLPAEVLGPAPAADAQLQGSGYLLLVRGENPPVAGMALRVFLSTGPEQPVLVVPRSALVQHQGSEFVYVAEAEGRFTRKLVEVGRVFPAGVAITAGLAAEDRVVTVGAQQLLSTELQAAGVSGD